MRFYREWIQYWEANPVKVSIVSWSAFIIAFSLGVGSRLSAESDVTYDIDYREWRALVDECAAALFDAGAYGVGLLLLDEGEQSGDFRVHGYSPEFVRVRTLVVELDGTPFLETRYVTLNRLDYPSLYATYDHLSQSGLVPGNRNTQ